jgi:hypothetical protein
MCDCKDERARVLPTPVTDKSGFIFRASLVVDISVGTFHSIPQPGETWMKEPQPPHTAI